MSLTTGASSTITFTYDDDTSSNNDHPDLDTLLIHLRAHVTSKWQQFGLAVGLSEELLEKYNGYPPEECIVEVMDIWLRDHPLTTDKPTWSDVVKALREIELHELADILLNKYKNGMETITLPIMILCVDIECNRLGYS